MQFCKKKIKKMEENKKFMKHFAKKNHEKINI